MRYFLLLGVIAILLIIVSCSDVGKASKPAEYSEPNVPVTQITPAEVKATFDYKNAEAELKAKEKTLQWLSWFRGMMVLGIFGCGVASILGQSKYGIPGAILCAIMFGIAVALNDYWELIGFVSLGLGVAVGGFALYQHRKELFTTQTALTEVVQGVEAAKAVCSKVAINSALGTLQSAATTKLVSAIKEAL
jgi:hypothetical protein